MAQSDHARKTSRPLRHEGFTWPEMVELTHIAILKLLDQPNALDTRVTLIIHDVGAMVGNAYTRRHPERVKRVVCLDVGPGYPLDDTPQKLLRSEINDEPQTEDFQRHKARVLQKHPEMKSSWAANKHYRKAVHVFYQLAIALGHWIQLNLGHAAACVYMKISTYFIFYSPLSRIINPVSATDLDGPDLLPEPARPYVCYPYYYGTIGLVKKMLLGKEDANFDIFNSVLLPKDPALPYLFIWGQDKNTFFHSTLALAKLEERQQQGHKCKYLSLPGGHWFFNQDSSERTFQEVVAFMDLTIAAPAPAVSLL
jgi:pimeloyl-ACP methyl ester carboxylesterase